MSPKCFEGISLKFPQTITWGVDKLIVSFWWTEVTGQDHCVLLNHFFLAKLKNLSLFVANTSQRYLTGVKCQKITVPSTEGDIVAVFKPAWVRQLWHKAVIVSLALRGSCIVSEVTTLMTHKNSCVESKQKHDFHLMQLNVNRWASNLESQSCLLFSHLWRWQNLAQCSVHNKQTMKYCKHWTVIFFFVKYLWAVTVWMLWLEGLDKTQTFSLHSTSNAVLNQR